MDQEELNQSPQREMKQMYFMCVFFLECWKKGETVWVCGRKLIAGDYLPPNQDKGMEIEVWVLILQKLSVCLSLVY